MTTKHILIVDDDKDFAEGIAEILELEGHEPLLAFNGEDALEIIKSKEIDIVFMDIRMPGMDGVATFERALKLKPDIRVAMMTGYSDKELVDTALRYGAEEILYKPVVMEKFISLISRNGVNDIILLIDDDKDFCESLKSTLELHDYIVSVAQDMDEAMAVALNNKIKLLLLDIRLSEISGLDIYLKLKEQGHTPPTIIITAYANEEQKQIEEIKSYTSSQVFQKPFNPEKLLEAIKEIQ